MLYSFSLFFPLLLTLFYNFITQYEGYPIELVKTISLRIVFYVPQSKLFLIFSLLTILSYILLFCDKIYLTLSIFIFDLLLLLFTMMMIIIIIIVYINFIVS